MRISSAATLCVFAMVSSVTMAQAPASPQEKSSPGTPSSAGATGQGPAAARGGANAATAMGRPADANSPAQAGRQALYVYLDGIAAQDEMARRAEIAKITTRDEAVARQQEVRTKLLALMGGGFQRTPLNAKVVGQTQMDGFRIEKVVYESQPNFFVTALMYLPDPTHRDTTTMNGAPNVGGGKLPAIVMAPGHAASGKAGDYAMATTFARNGFVVLSYDPIGQGERLQYMDPKSAATVAPGSPYPGTSLATRPTGEHGEAGLQPTLIGDAVARYFAWDGVRAVDYLISRPEVDAEKIGAFGCSGGGAMTALLGAADRRVKAVATACYLTTFDTLLATIGAQDAEQSVPGFIASGFDFADWVELAAPRAYAMVGTVSDMFPWAGFLETAKEARRFYSLFDASAAGTPTGKPQPPTPTGPTLNPDTGNDVAASAPFQVITGIGGHGNLRPIQAQIVGFFLVHLAGKSADAYVADAVAQGQGAVNSPGSTASNLGHPAPAGALQVTPTGQVAASFPGSETVFSLNLKRAKEKLPQLPVQTLRQVQTDVREVTEAEAVPGAAKPKVDLIPPKTFCDNLTTVVQGIADLDLQLPVVVNSLRLRGGPRPALLMLESTEDAADSVVGKRMCDASAVVMAFTPRPSPPGGEETKAAILGPFYMTELRAELVGKTILGMRVDDVIRAVDYLASRPDVDPTNITVVASGHMGLVALHAAVLDSQIKHVTVDHVLESYASLLKAPMPLDAPQDILPGVLLKYDIPDLVRVLGDRVTATDWLPGTADLSGK